MKAAAGSGCNATDVSKQCQTRLDGITRKRRATQDNRKQDVNQPGCPSQCRFSQDCLLVQELCRVQQQQIKDCKTTIRKQQQLLMLQQSQLQASLRKCECLLKLVFALTSTSARKASKTLTTVPSTRSSSPGSSNKSPSPPVLSHASMSDQMLSLASAATRDGKQPVRYKHHMEEPCKKVKLTAAATGTACSLPAASTMQYAAAAASEDKELRRLLEEALMMGSQQQRSCTPTQQTLLGCLEPSRPQQQQQQQQQNDGGSPAAHHSSTQLHHLTRTSNLGHSPTAHQHGAAADQSSFTGQGLQAQWQTTPQYYPRSAVAAATGHQTEQVHSVHNMQPVPATAAEALTDFGLAQLPDNLAQPEVNLSGVAISAGDGIAATCTTPDAALVARQPTGLDGMNLLNTLNFEHLEAEDNLGDLLSLFN